MPTAAQPESPSPPAPAQADPACLPSGFRLNEYVIDRPLGGGGFGITYLARDGNLQLPVAIKEYFPSDLVSRDADQSVHVRMLDAEHQQRYEWGLERFLDEARALATFRHPNIIRVLRYFREHGTAYIVMEYESGLSLKRWLPGNTPLSQRALLSIIYPMLDGLEAVHKTGFLHRDIKPDNIYVRADGTPVLLDFGAARRVTANQEVTNIISPGYAPFEQYHSEGHQGPWTDIYSLGAVMYWMTTGKKPVESAARVVKDTMVPAARMADAGIYGTAMLEAIDWAMHPDETRRPQTVALLRAALLGSEREDLEASQSDAHSDAPTVMSAGSVRSQSRSAASSESQTPAAAGHGLADDDLQEVESELARHIGPLARVLVRKAARVAPTVKALREALAASIQEPKAREAFIAGPTGATLSHRSHTVSKRPSGASMPLASEPLGSSRLQPGASASAISSAPSQRANSSVAQSGNSAAQAPMEISADELLIIERTLSKFIGPLAKVLIRRERARTSGFKEFVEALAATVDRPDERDEFRRALKQALPRRPQ